MSVPALCFYIRPDVLRLGVCTYVCMYVSMHACMYVCMYLYMYVCVCMDVVTEAGRSTVNRTQSGEQQSSNRGTEAIGQSGSRPNRAGRQRVQWGQSCDIYSNPAYRRVGFKFGRLANPEYPRIVSKPRGYKQI
jgi:hypothetical protein